MKHYSIICQDGPEGLELRAKTRPAHLDYIMAAGENVKLAGAMRNENDQPIGSVIVIEAGSLDEARAFAEGDPYSKAGVFQTVWVTPYNPVLGQWLDPKE